MHDIIPVKDVLLKRRITTDALCPLCKEDRESVHHLLVQCPFAQVMWRISPLGLYVAVSQGGSLISWRGGKESRSIRNCGQQWVQFYGGSGYVETT